MDWSYIVRDSYEPTEVDIWLIPSPEALSPNESQFQMKIYLALVEIQGETSYS